MTNARVDRGGRPARGRRWKTALLCVLLGGGFARTQAADYPHFSPGLWRLQTTLDVNGKRGTRQASKCGDPTDGMRAIFAPAAPAQGCESSAPSRHGNRYRISTDCGRRGRSRVEVLVHSESGFTQTVETTLGGSQVKEVIDARRIGPCGD